MSPSSDELMIFQQIRFRNFGMFRFDLNEVLESSIEIFSGYQIKLKEHQRNFKNIYE